MERGFIYARIKSLTCRISLYVKDYAGFISELIISCNNNDTLGITSDTFLQQVNSPYERMQNLHSFQITILIYKYCHEDIQQSVSQPDLRPFQSRRRFSIQQNQPSTLMAANAPVTTQQITSSDLDQVRSGRIASLMIKKSGDHDRLSHHPCR
ncbi:hypothetical protein A0U92_15660 [Acetobacter aceti]|uniref:Uncharacterized protein n=1 Tax=Acetobacter aceti TaxID=435 RepID=A0A1U9KJM6_ACEAC|nr:hypothetical protein A0U92_15660 [Acetobacter aceti]